MANILSQDEVDSLLDGISDGKVEVETDIPESSGEVAAYDFTTSSDPIHLRMPALGIVNERFVGLLRTSLPVVSRSVIDINLSTTESVKFGDFSRSVPLPASLNIFKMEPLRGFSLLVLEGALVFSFVEGLFGGSGAGHVKLEGRGFTSIETKIIEKIVKIILKDLQQAWAEILEIKAVFTRSEMDPQFVGIVTPEDVIIVNKFIIDLENGSGSMTICTPYSSLEPIRARLKSRHHGERQETDHTWHKYLKNKIGQISLELSCNIGTAKINSKELLQMKVDDVIVLDQKIGEAVVVNIEGIPKFSGYPGSCNNKKAVKIGAKLS
jgi:flagellar motor switch protein FliM